MRIPNGSFSGTVRQWWWTHQLPRLHQLQSTVVRRSDVADVAKGRNNGTFHCCVGQTAKYFTGGADTEQNCTASNVTEVSRPVSSYTGTDTFINCLGADNSTKNVCTIAHTTPSFKGCNTSTNVVDLTASFHNVCVPHSCTICTKGAFLLRSSAAHFCTRRTKPVRTAFSRLADNNTTRCAHAAEFPIDRTDGNSVGNSYHEGKTYLDHPALSGFDKSRWYVPNICYDVPGGRKNIAAHEQVDTQSNAKGALQWITEHHISETTAASPTACCTHVPVGSGTRPRRTQADVISAEFALRREIPIQACNWLLKPTGGLRVSLPFIFRATRSFFGKTFTKADSGIATNSCGAAALPSRQPISAHDARGASSVVSSKRGGNGIVETASLSDTKEKPLSANAAVRNNGTSHLKVAEDEGILEKQNKISAFRLLSPAKKEPNCKGDSLPRAGSTASGNDKTASKNATIPLSRKLRSFIFGFFFASGCSFFIMYCQVADATLMLQQIAKDATHRLAVLESRMLELEKKVGNC